MIMCLKSILLTTIALGCFTNNALASTRVLDVENFKSVSPGPTDGRPRVIATSDGEIDDECSMVRFLLYANDWDVEAIITSSSQYHWHGHRWAGDDWVDLYLEAYT